MIKNMEQEVEKLLKEFSENSKIHLDQRRKILDEKIRDIINIYSNDIRNLSIISGVVAPFSLTLLGLEKLNVNSPILLIGFSLLILNIVLSQLFLNQQVNKDYGRISRADAEWLFASIDQDEIGSDPKYSADKVLKQSEILKNFDKLDNDLGLKTPNIDLFKKREAVRKRNKITIIIFAFGTIAIVLSVIVNPIMNQLSQWNMIRNYGITI